MRYRPDSKVGKPMVAYSTLVKDIDSSEDIPEGPNIPKVLNFHSNQRYYSSSFIYPQVGEATIGLPIWIAFSPQELVSERTPANSCQECVCVACCLDRRGHNVCVSLVVYDKIGLRWRGHYIWNDEKM